MAKYYILYKVDYSSKVNIDPIIFDTSSCFHGFWFRCDSYVRIAMKNTWPISWLPNLVLSHESIWLCNRTYEDSTHPILFNTIFAGLVTVLKALVCKWVITKYKNYFKDCDYFKNIQSRTLKSYVLSIKHTKMS